MKFSWLNTMPETELCADHIEHGRPKTLLHEDSLGQLTLAGSL